MEAACPRGRGLLPIPWNAWMPSITGRRQSLSLPRRLVGDLLHAGRALPLVTFERRMRLGPVLDARKRLPEPPPWSLLFVKAFAIVARQRPELRRTFLTFPWPQLFEADESVAAIAVERNYQGEPGVFFGLLKSPDLQPLSEMAATLRRWRTEPVEAVRPFRRCLKYARLPQLLRRMLWWCAGSCSGRLKTNYFGTFGVSVTASGGAAALHLISPVTSTLNYGTFASDGSLDVRLHFDHRVFDGMPATRALADLEEALLGPILQELQAMESPRPEWSRLRVSDYVS